MRFTIAIAGAAVALAIGSAAAAQPAPPPPDAERMALAQQIYDAMGSQTLGATSKAVRSMMTTMMQSAGGTDTARERAEQAALGDSMDKMMPRVLHGSIEIMAQEFTSQELRDMLAFYRSPTGHAVLEKMPAVTQQTVRLSLSLMPQMMRDFETDYCGRVTCSDKEKTTFAEVDARMAQAATHSPAQAPAPAPAQPPGH